MFNQNIKAPVNIPVSKIHPFEGNPYKVQDNDEMNNLIGSIQEQGILTPIISAVSNFRPTWVEVRSVL